MTLVEVLITFALLAMVMMGVYFSLHMALRYQRKLADSVETFERALHVSTRLSQSLGNGAQSSLVVEPDGLAFASAVSDSGAFTHDPDGKLQWQRYEYFYLSQERLYRGTVPFPPTSTLPATPSLSHLRSQGQAPILLASGVKELEVTTGSGATTRLVIEGGDPSLANLTTLESRVTFRQ